MRFLALVSNYDRYAELSEIAADSEDIATLQVLKTMDSIEAKQQQLQTSLQTLYTDSGLQGFYKGILDVGKTIIDQFTAMPKVFNLPIAAVVDFGVKFANLAHIVLTVTSAIKQKYAQDYSTAEATMTKIQQVESDLRKQINQIETDQAKLNKETEVDEYNRLEQEKTQLLQEATNKRRQIIENSAANKTSGGWLQDSALSKSKAGTFINQHKSGISVGLSAAGLGLSVIGGGLKTAGYTGAGNTLNILGSAASYAGIGLMMGNVWGAVIGGALGIITSVINNWGDIFKSSAKKLEEAQAEAQEASNKALQARSDTKSLKASIDELKKLEAARYDSVEAEEEYYQATEKLAQTYPDLINGMDDYGNVTLDLDAAERQLTASRQEAIEVARTAAVANFKAAKKAEEVKEGEFATNYTKAFGVDSIMTPLMYWREEKDKNNLSSEQQSLVTAANSFFADPNALLNGLVFKQLEQSELDNMKTLYSSFNDIDTHQDWINAVSNLKEFDASNLNADSFEDFLYQYLSYVVNNGPIMKSVSDSLSSSTNTLTVIKSGIASTIGMALQDYSESVLSEMNNINEVIQYQVYSAALKKKIPQGSDKDFENFLVSQEAELGTLIEPFQSIWKNLSVENQKAVNDLMVSVKDYSPEQFTGMLIALFETAKSIESEIDISSLASVVSGYSYQSAYTTEDATKKLRTLTNLVFDGLQSTFDTMGETELKAATGYAEYLNNMVDQGKLGGFDGQGQKLLNAYTAVWQSLPDDETLREPAQHLLVSWDKSLSGLNSIIDAFEQLGLDTEALEELKAFIPKNLNTEVSSLQVSFINDLENYTDILSKAGKGLEYKEATELANKLGISLQDLEYNAVDGLYYYYDAAELANTYFKDIGSQMRDLGTILDNLENFATVGHTEEETDIAKRTDGIQNLEVESEEGKQQIQSWAQTYQIDEATLTSVIVDYQAAVVENADLLFLDFLKDRYINLYDNMQSERKNQTARFYLNQGLISNFLETLEIEEATPEQIEQLAHGIVPEELSAQLEIWRQAVHDAYNNAVLNTYSELFDALSKGASTVKITSSNRQALTDILGAGAIKDGYADLTGITIDGLWTNVLANAESYSNDELAALWQEYAKVASPSVKPSEALSDLAASYEDVSDDIIQKLISAFGGEIFNTLLSESASGKWQVTDVEALRTYISDKLGTDLKTTNEVLAQLNEHQYKLSATGILSDIINDYDSLSETQVASLATLLNRNTEEVKKMLAKNGDGTYKIGISQLHQYINQFGLQSNQAIQSMLTDLFDDVLSDITGLAGSQIKGFTKLSDIRKYVTTINEQLGGQPRQYEDLFEYSNTLHAFVLNTGGIIEYTRSLAQQLITLSEDEQFVVSKLIGDTGRQFAESIDLIGYANATTDAERKLARTNLEKAVSDYNAYIKALGVGSSIIFEELMAALDKGGIAAVTAAEQIAQLQGTTLSTEQITTLYTQKSSKLLNAFEQVTYSLGNIVDSTTASILKSSGYDLQEIGNTGSYIIQTTGNMVGAYNSIYRQLLLSGTATLEDLNRIKAQVYTAKSDTQLVEALGNAASMSYEALGNIFTSQGKLMTERALKTMQDSNLISDIGGGSLRINDFEAFAKMMGFSDSDSEAYLSAFKSYNDSLIELNNYTEKQITNEVAALKDAKVGDQLNLTYLYSMLNEKGLLGQLNEALNSYGAILAGGILDISSNGNIAGIIQTISSYAKDYGGLLEEEVAQLADVLKDALKAFTDTVSKGIKGTLTSVEANELKITAKNMIGLDLTFVETTEGLKLSNQQAIQLYSSLSKIDNISAARVFSDLKEILEEAGEACENISSTMASIARLEAEAAKNSGKLTDEKQQQLDLYKQIANVQMQDANQYDFMGRSLSDAFKGPVNYWNSIGDMFSTIIEAKNGYMEVQDFYNIVNELSNMAAMSGPIEFMGKQIDGSLETAASLIEEGFSHLSNVDGEGVQIDLSKFGANFSDGAAAMGDDVEAGIHAMAESQIEMLDGMIKLLETVVAMEQLGDIDVDSNGNLDFLEMFTYMSLDTVVASQAAHEAAGNILELSENNTKLAEGLENFKIDGITLREILQQLADGATLTEEDAKKYNAALNALYQMVLSGDYDLENVYQSILQVAEQSKFVGEIQIGDRTIAVGYGVTLEPNEDGHYNIAGKDYSSAERALEAFSLTQFLNTNTARGFTVDLEGEKPIVINEELGFEIYYNDNQEMQFRYNNQSFSSFDEMVAYAWDTYYSSELARNGQVIVPEDLAATEAEFKAQFYGTITYTESHVEIDQNSLEQISHAEYVAAQKALLSGSYDDENLQKIVKIDTVLADGQVDISQSDWEKVTQALGIESIAVQLTTGEIDPSIQAILDLITSENKTVTLQLDFSGSETATAFLDKLSEIEEDNLNEIADTLARMASAANALSSVSWDSVVNGVNTLSAPDQGQTGTTIGAAIAFQDDRTRELIETGTLDSEVNIIINESMIQSILDAMSLQVNVTPVMANVPTTTTPTSTNINNAPTANAVNAVKVNPIDSAVVESMNSAAEAISAAGAAMTDVSSKLSNAANAVEELGIKAVTMGSQVSTAGGRVQSASNAIAGGANVASNRLYTVRDALNGIPVMKQLTLQLRVTTTGAVSLMGSPTRNVTLTRATGNVALAAGTTKKTLVGELGPELMVTNGRYFLVGQNGAEMVDMPEDAIVFNHIQTEKLLKNGRTGRGNAVHGERKATALATGNIEGPAMASASAALAQLKQIRAMWQSLLNASLKDMGQLGGTGSGGGGGGGGNSGIDPGFLADLERWYTLTQQIAKLEKEINYEEKLRSKLSSDLNKQGEEYYYSQVRSLENLTAQVEKQRELASLQKSYYEARAKDLEESPFGQIYHMEDGVLVYNDAIMDGTDQRGGLLALAELFRQKDTGETVYNAEEQYNLLKEWGFEKYLLYDDQGKEIDLSEEGGYTNAVEAFWDKAQAYIDELDSLYDSYTDTLQDIVDNEVAINEIIQDMIDNQLDLENKILNAIIEREQAVIDELKDTRDAIDDAQTAFIDGLQDQLDKEKQMYENQETEEETNRLRRQLAILQRSGGSAASIAALQKQIQQAEQDAYFDAQQEQIDAIQEASDKEIERLDAQINLMTETLAYQKEHGLLWSEVYQVMSMTKEEIASFITMNSKDWESYSALYKQTEQQSLEFIIEQYKARAEDVVAANNGTEGKVDWVGKELSDTIVSASRNIETKLIEHNGDDNDGIKTTTETKTTTTGGSGGGGGGSSGGGGSVVSTAAKEPEYGYVYVTYVDINGKALERPNTVTKKPGTYKSSQFSVRISNYTLNNSNENVVVTAGNTTSLRLWYSPQKTTTTMKTTTTKTTTTKTSRNSSVSGSKVTYGQYASGGLVDYTGPAWVDGTKRKPEAFLDAATTKMWKEDILSNKNTSLTSTLLQMNEMLSNAASNSLTTNTNNGMSIDKIEVNMNVASIANDYDARRAGEQAVNEMIRIARKTGAQSIRR